MPSIPFCQPHKQRPIRFLRMEKQELWSIKLYAASFTNDGPRDKLVSDACREISMHLTTVRNEHYTHHIGFALVHEDRDNFDFVGLHWWRNEYHLGTVSWTRQKPGDRLGKPYHAMHCLCDLAVMAFESQAWHKHVLLGRNVDAYMTYVLDTTI